MIERGRVRDCTSKYCTSNVYIYAYHAMYAHPYKYMHSTYRPILQDDRKGPRFVNAFGVVIFEKGHCQLGLNG